MADSNANEEAAAVEHLTQVRSQKQIIGHEEGNDPALEPLFATHFEVFRIGSDIYLDIGIVRPEEIVSLRQRIESAPSETHSITFNVLQRVAMSQDGFERLKAGVDVIVKALRGEEVAS